MKIDARLIPMDDLQAAILLGFDDPEAYPNRSADKIGVAWFDYHDVTSAVASRFGGDDNWPGDAFHEKVKRALDGLRASDAVVKIGRGEPFPTPSGQMGRAYGPSASQPRFQTAANAAKIQQAFDERRAAMERREALRSEREARIREWVAVHEPNAEPEGITLDASGMVTLPVHVFETILMKAAREARDGA